MSVALAFILSSSASAQSLFGDFGVVEPSSVTMKSESKEEILTKGETISFPAGGISSLRSAAWSFFLKQGTGTSGDHIADIRFDVRDIGRYDGDFVPGTTYVTKSGAPIAAAPKGPYLSASLDGRNCNDEVNTKGEWDMEEYEWRAYYFPKGALVVDEFSGKLVPILRDRYVGYVLTRFKATVRLHCNGESSTMEANVDIVGQLPAQAGTPGLLEVIGPRGECWDPRGMFDPEDPKNIIGVHARTGGPCSAGTPSGPGDGGAPIPVPNLPPLPPPPDVNIVLPPAFAESPRIQLANNGKSSFTFTTSPATGISADVHLSVTSDASDADNFQVSITPSFIPAPGIGEATVNISVGPDTFPRDYLVTVTALANDKTANTTFIVSVTCDPPMILGIDQPKSQRVDPNTRATLTVKPAGSGPFSYQWYSGRRGNTRTPISGATGASFVTPGVTDSSSYWVRVSNACGTIDSSTVTVSPR